MIKPFAVIAAATGAMLLLAGCGSPSAVPQDHYYRLNVDSSDKMGAPMISGAVEVSRFVADGAVANRPVLYTNANAPNAVSEYNYNFWIEAPPTLLKDALVTYLRASGVADRVVTPEMRFDAKYAVVARIKRLEVRTGDRPQGVASFELGLRRNADDELLVLDDYEAVVDAAGDTVPELIVAVDKAVDQVFSEFVNDIPKL